MWQENLLQDKNDTYAKRFHTKIQQQMFKESAY